MFVGGLLPGIILVLFMAVTGVVSSLKNHIKPVPFSLREALSSIKGAIWELLLPVIIILLYFSGIASIVETAAVAVLYIIIIEVFVEKDIKLRDLPKVSLKAVWIIGGILVILGLARGLSYFIVDAQVPTQLAAWVSAHIHSKVAFLLILNLALIIAGMFLDVYSSILVLVPLLIPLGEVFGIHPVQLGVIFLINMEHGMITPPLGLNLYFSSYCFNKPLLKVCKDVLPFWLIQLAMLLLVTFVPWLSTFLLDIIKFK
jgi:tripartite ATP-independent transporter DctM subunit